MTSELIINAQPKEVSIALLEDKRLAEFQKEGRDEQFAVGNIYLGKVKKIMTGLNACFVNVGYEREAFLHYSELGPRFRSYTKLLELIDRGKTIDPMRSIQAPIMEKEGSLENELKVGQQVLVQIIKEPISTKGPRLTCELSFAGRLLVLVPYSDKISVSSKIKKNSERARLKQLMQSIMPAGFGVVVRTVAEGKRVAELDAELRILISRWENMIRNMSSSPERPLKVYEDSSRAVGMLRDLFNTSFENIYVDDEQVYREISEYVKLIAPERHHIVKHYKGKLPILDNFSITQQIKKGFGRIVTFNKGAYLVIEHTEALHVVDVNSGNRSRSDEGQEVNALEVNLSAADELAHQLRLRDMGGIIVVDFIDMNDSEHRQKLYERMCQNMQSDRAKHTVLPLSKFGLMQITRQRVRPAMDVRVEEACPTCGGSGTIKSSLLFTDVLENKIRKLHQVRIRSFRLHLHPFVAAYINKGLFSIHRQWQWRYGWNIQIIPDQSFSLLEYKFYRPNGEEIDMYERDEMM